MATPTELSLSQALLRATANFAKILIFLIIPLLLLAAFIEANITPRIVLAFHVR